MKNNRLFTALFTDDSWLKINKHGSRHVLARSRLAEERVERIIGFSN